MTYTATFSPDDGKLRLYASGRLDAETYARVKAAGFRWAPKQDLFVAPAWTPGRADLLEELAGEIGDEDTSLVERAEERADRFGDYSAARLEDAEGARAAVARIADGIPFGQPILVGHHSERHARRDAEKIENGMRRAVKMWETSKYWTDRAAGAIRHAKYKERPDVRARRIKGLEADERKQVKVTAEADQQAALWLACDSLERARHLANFHSFYVVAVAGGNWWSAWDVLRPDEDRYKACPAWTWEQVRAKAADVMVARIAGAGRWLEHYRGRLEYERAMLAEAGGTVAERTGPEKGGGCRCWASPRGGWSYIQKVNKVSVTVLDNWGNGGPCFTRTMPFDKLAAVMTAAEVQAAREAGRLVEVGKDSTGQVEGFYLHEQAPADPESAPALEAEPEPTPQHGDWDEAGNCRLCGEAGRCPAAAPSLPYAEPEPSQADLFGAMKATLRAGVEVVSAPQLFPTPPALARLVVELADVQEGHRILEPSAGTGALLAALPGDTTRLAVEVNPRLADATRLHQLAAVRCADFLACRADLPPHGESHEPGTPVLGTFDRIVMNPPFHNGEDVRHILHARTFLKPGGRLVALCANGPRQRAALEPIASEWRDLPAGSFKDSGTNVNAALVVIDAPSTPSEMTK